MRPPARDTRRTRRTAERVSWRPLGELTALLVGSCPGIELEPVLCDRDPDPGLFGPGSATWRVAREPVMLLGGGRALLMQVAHPLVAQGVVDHSRYATDPFGRLLRTVRWLVAVTFGTTAEARAATAGVVTGHRRVRGRTPVDGPGGRPPAGTPYDAGDPTLVRWVHATIVDSMLVTHEAVIGPLPAAVRDGVVREWNAVGRMVGVPERSLWPDAATMRAYITSATAELPPAGAATREAAGVVLHPPLPTAVLRPLFGSVAFLTVGLLDDPLRRAYGLRWSPVHRSLHGALCRGARAAHLAVPRRLRESPIYRGAVARCEAGRAVAR